MGCARGSGSATELPRSLPHRAHALLEGPSRRVSQGDHTNVIGPFPMVRAGWGRIESDGITGKGVVATRWRDEDAATSAAIEDAEWAPPWPENVPLCASPAEGRP